MNLAFLASHNGTNMQAIINACSCGILNSRPVLVISNNKDSGAIARAKKENISFLHISSKTHTSADKIDLAVLDALKKHDADIIILAGYMKKIGTNTLAHYKNRILNIHPALLPKFGGKGMYGIHVHEAVLAAGEKETGVTVHIVDENYDTGQIIAQYKVPVLPSDTPESLQSRVLDKEHKSFTETLKKIEDGEIQLPGM